MKHRFIALIGWLLLGCQLLLAQPSYTCQYWFDGNYNSHFDTTVTTGHWQTLIETGHLPFGLHTLYMHLQDSSGRWTAPRSFLFLRTEDTLSSHAPSYTCWFDQDRNDTLQQGTIGNGTLLIDVATIDNGLHTFNLQLGEGLAARLQSFLFYKVPVADSSGLNMTYSCWFDQDTSTMQSGSVASSHLLIDATDISIGLHTLNLQLNAGGLTQLQSYMFYRMPILNTGTAQIVYRCWFDQDYATLQQGNIAGGHLLIETTSLSDGLHTLNIELGSGSMARLSSHLFMKMASIGNATDTTPLLWHYSIDGRDYPPISVSRNGGLIHLDVDVSTIPEGLHTLSHFMTTQQGTTFGVNSSLFYKIPVGGNGVKQYEYWFNDDYANRVTAVLDTVADPFRLVQLLDVDTLPFRSMSFQFDPYGGSPRCYAKNKIDFRFWDGMSRYVSRFAEFVDQRVMQVVTADTLERDTTKVIPVPNNNAIHWFKLYAGVGDSLSFHTDRHCTMQLFAPSGEEVFSASGQDVLTWHGCHAWEDGIFYLAVHDAEGTGNISVSYQWIYRYAVLAWDAPRIGNAHQSIITIDGNGFDNLIAIGLYKNYATDTLWAQDFFAERNTCVKAMFQFDSAELGTYNVILRYTDEDMPISNIMMVVPSFEGELTSSLDYYSTTAQDTLQFTLRVTNTGNISALGVPIELKFRSPSGTVRKPKIICTYTGPSGREKELTPNSINNPFYQGLTQEEVTEIKQWIEEYFADDLLLNKHLDDNGNEVRENTFFIDIPPLSSLDISIQSPHTLLPHQSADIECIVPKYNRYQYDEISANETPGDNHISHWCEHHDKYECVANLVGAGLTAAGVTAWAGLAINAATTLSSAITKKVCHQNIEIDDVLSTGHFTLESMIVPTSAHLLENSSATLQSWKNGLGVAGNLLTAYQCYKAFRPSRERHHHGRIEHVVPSDPNDIIGYSSESNSHFIRENVLNIGYTIEFENDSNIASSHAHSVIISDTLDENAFDLESFSASSFTIGDDVTSINGGQSFIRTVDMRPDIDALAQVQLDYRIDTSFAVATWTFTSLDPMTLLPTVADSLGFLRIGGTGEVDFTINRKSNLPDSTLIDNRAWIVFDNEDPIATSTWRNIIDNTPPVSSIDSITYSGSTATVTINATDNLSGVWQYNVYAIMDGDVLLPMAMNVPIDSAAVFTTPDEVVQFRSTAIDSAGNVETLVLTPLITTVYDTLTITACDNYTWGDSLYTISGEYTQSKTATLRNAPDTVATLILTVNHSTTATESATACDSYTWHGTAYTTSTNTPTYSTTNVQGCDSTVTLSLIINNSSTNVESVTACDSYTWHGTAYTASTNTPTYSTTNAQGCDSTVTLHLTVNNSSTGIDEVNACNSYTWHGTTYTVSTNTPTYTSLNAAGCDSVTTLHLTINQSLSSIEDITACDSYTWHGTAYTVSTYTPTYSTTNAYGCDSTITLHLTINNSTTAIETATACDSYTWHGNAYTASTNTPTYSTTNAYGCDSTVTLHLTINYSTSAIETATACDSYTWHDSVYTASTLNSQFSTLNSQGCDSTVTLHLTINNSTTAIETATACDSYTWHDSIYTASTLNSQFSTLNSQGCDSTITLHLTINNSTSAIETITACDSYTWHDSVYTASTSDAHFSTLNSAGCDSTVTLHLTINYSTHDTIVDSAVGSYTWHGNTYTESGEYSFESLTEDGCDSVIVLQLTINEVGISTVDSLGHITLYPNPTTGWVTIVHDGVSSVEVFDQSGCCIATFHGTSLFNIKDLPTGVYTLRITYQGGSAVKRIIKH